MFMTTADSRVPAPQTQAQEIIKNQMEQWFAWIDGILDTHRSSFVFREVTPAELEQHKRGLGYAIRTCLLITTLVCDPEFNEPDLARRLQVRIRQLQDAYDTFHDSELSDEKADRILRHVFPE
jgi:hypothetical protein